MVRMHGSGGPARLGASSPHDDESDRQHNTCGDVLPVRRDVEQVGCITESPAWRRGRPSRTLAKVAVRTATSARGTPRWPRPVLHFPSSSRKGRRMMSFEISSSTSSGGSWRSRLSSVAAPNMVSVASAVSNNRNDDRDRLWEKRARAVDDRIPELLKGGYYPGFFEAATQSRVGTRRRRAKRTSKASRSVDESVRAKGTTAMSKSQVSQLCSEIDESVGASLDRPLEGEMAAGVDRCGVREGRASWLHRFHRRANRRRRQYRRCSGGPRRRSRPE